MPIIIIIWCFYWRAYNHKRHRLAKLRATCYCHTSTSRRGGKWILHAKNGDAFGKTLPGIYMEVKPRMTPLYTYIYTYTYCTRKWVCMCASIDQHCHRNENRAHPWCERDSAGDATTATTIRRRVRIDLNTVYYTSTWYWNDTLMGLPSPSSDLTKNVLTPRQITYYTRTYVGILPKSSRASWVVCNVPEWNKSQSTCSFIRDTIFKPHSHELTFFVFSAVLRR